MQVEPIRNFFAALFLASIGMLIHVHFLWNHVDILLASVILVVVVKTIVISAVVEGFGYNNKTSLLVGKEGSCNLECVIRYQLSFGALPNLLDLCSFFV
ncbi:K(+) efflux antiporter 4 [Olea europaea subsp. europaea]|uniref:K(+) efflux antiporter 4 n=1 Tax=Olea europaea subsp. europaea TaxID=158383 RepID=A0A8S0RLK7_OLEEU|nr:K(+) efflux antiporter 4 [Olea europaea subsp. europaea]